MITKTELLDDLRRRLVYKSQRRLAGEIGLHHMVIYRALRPLGRITPELARALGYEPVTMYEPVEEDWEI